MSTLVVLSMYLVLLFKSVDATLDGSQLVAWQAIYDNVLQFCDHSSLSRNNPCGGGAIAFCDFSNSNIITIEIDLQSGGDCAIQDGMTVKWNQPLFFSKYI